MWRVVWLVVVLSMSRHARQQQQRSVMVPCDAAASMDYCKSVSCGKALEI
jgi:hypothetical protein